MDKYKETFQTWNKIASIYEDKFMDLDLYNDTYDIFSELITKRNSAILEIGCGPGNITKYLLDKRSDYKITATDIAPNMIELAKKNNITADFKVLDSRDIGDLKIEYDAIIAGFCIPYLSKEDCSKLIKDSSNLLVGTGVIYLSFVEGNYEDSNYQSGSSGDRIFFYYHNLNSFKKELEINGFEMVEIIYKKFIKSDKSEEIHTILIAKKRTHKN
jgi:cyclopropane fatty-acyl-phospholipid synthase-like methyltransferase